MISKVITHYDESKNYSQMMETINHKNNKSAIGQKDFWLAKEVFKYLNRGSLYEIYQIMDNLKGKTEEKTLEQTFLELYHFDFKQYI